MAFERAASPGYESAGLVLFARPDGLEVTNIVPLQLSELSHRAYNAILEEVIVLAYFVHRTAQLGWKPWQQVGSSAFMRAAYHLYQGFGGFLGNLAMGTLFAILFRRWGRVMPFLWAHFFIDAFAFVGYYFLAGHLPFLP